MALSARQKAFVRHILKGKPAAEAYRLVYPKCSRATAETNGPRLLRSAQVAQAVNEAQAKLNERVAVTLERWLEEWASMGFAPLAHPDVRPADKARALENIGKHLGFYPREFNPESRQPLSVDKTGKKTRITWGDLVLEV